MPESIFVRQTLSVASLGGFDVVHVHAGDVTPAIVAALHAEGLTAHANDASNAAEMHHALAVGVDRFSTDDVELGLEVVAELPGLL